MLFELQFPHLWKVTNKKNVAIVKTDKAINTCAKLLTEIQ